MENNNIKIRINLTQREFEIDGDPEYIKENYSSHIKDYLDIIKSQGKSDGSEVVNNGNNSGNISKVSKVEEVPSSFGEYFSTFNRGLNNVDRLLIAGYYIQLTSDNKSFIVSDASRLLLDQGIKLSNANVFNKANLDTKKVFKLSGKEFRVSEIGVNHINALKD